MPVSCWAPLVCPAIVASPDWPVADDGSESTATLVDAPPLVVGPAALLV